MGRLVDVRLDVTTDTNGDGSLVASRALVGRLYAVDLIDGTYDDGVDATLSCINTPSGVARDLLVIANYNTDQTLYPRTLLHGDSNGAALTGTAGGDRDMPLVNGTLKLVIAQGGNTKTGGVIAYVLV